MTNQESRSRLAQDPAELAVVESLLERYPDTDEKEEQRIADFVRKASSLDVGLLSSNKAAWAALDRLRASRPDLFRMGGKGWIVLAVIMAGTALMLAWLHSFAGR